MSLFQCRRCGCVENTAVSPYWWLSGVALRELEHRVDDYEKDDLAQWKRRAGANADEILGGEWCSACDPSEANPKWHDVFERFYLPKGQFVTADDGGLKHVETGRTDYWAFRLETEDTAPAAPFAKIPATPPSRPAVLADVPRPRAALSTPAVPKEPGWYDKLSMRERKSLHKRDKRDVRKRGGRS